jgi:diacylglycerol kinase family enzyme
MAETTQIILNPKGHLHRDGRIWMAGQREYLRRLSPAEVSLVDSGEEAAWAAKEAAMQGFGKIISVGGGEVAHGVVNGVMQLAESHRNRLKVGFLSLARPDLWHRALELPRNLERQLEILGAGHTLSFDVGRVDCLDESGGRLVRHFFNGASLGVTGNIRREWRDPESTLVQALRRITLLLHRFGSRRGPRVRLEAEEELLFEGRGALVLVMGGRYYPAMGQVAPQANPCDGQLDLTWFETSSTLDLLWKMGRLALPRMPGMAGPDWRCVERFQATALDEPIYLELDGQPTGRLPATFSVQRRALQVIVEPVAARLRAPQRALIRRIGHGRLVGNVRAGRPVRLRQRAPGALRNDRLPAAAAG